MGQIVLGVLLGCEIPDNAVLFDEDSDGGGLIEQWQKAIEPEIKKFAKKHKTAPWSAAGHFVPDTTYDSAPALLGFWVLCHHGKSCPEINGAIQLDTIQQSKGYTDALAAWTRWAKWAASKGMKLPEPQLFLAPTEVA
jgi:hypothetical protein